ncbi:DMT family transporter, partial [Metallibacterium sp.]|uniref:DMT family transporter n=1 Tax=Metallibacterium sp. TaxID=2940281 RepID=UPI002608D729
LGETLPPLTLNLVKNLLVLGMLVLTVQVLGTTPPRLDALGLGVTLLSGVLGMACADSLYFAALNRLGASRAGIIGNLYSPFVIGLSVLFLGESMRPLQWLGFALVSAGVLVVSRARGHATELDRRRLRQGVALGVAAIFLMAAAIVLIKPWLGGQPVLWIVLLRTLGGLLGLLVLFAWRREAPWRTLSGRRVRWPLLLLAAFVGQYLAVLMWVGGYKYAPATVAAILNETSSVFIVLLAALSLREPLGARKLLGVACTLAGVACLLLA